jgi:hypothetical protein
VYPARGAALEELDLALRYEESREEVKDDLVGRFGPDEPRDLVDEVVEPRLGFPLDSDRWMGAPAAAEDGQQRGARGPERLDWRRVAAKTAMKEGRRETKSIASRRPPIPSVPASGPDSSMRA